VSLTRYLGNAQKGQVQLGLSIRCLSIDIRVFHRVVLYTIFLPYNADVASPNQPLIFLFYFIFFIKIDGRIGVPH
jgi:hypothetical protein